MPQPIVSVIIPFRNAGRTIGLQLAALQAQAATDDYEVLVLDHGSVPEHRTLLEEALAGYKQARIVEAAGASNLGAVRNIGIHSAAGSMILLCDADDIVQPGWVEGLTDGLAHFDMVGGSFDEDSLNDEVVRGWRPSRPANQLPFTFGVHYAVGANLGIRTDIARKLLFDEHPSSGAGDVEFSWRAQHQGFTLGFVPNAVVQYRYRDSLPEYARQMFRYGIGGAHLARQIRASEPSGPLNRRTSRAFKAARLAVGLASKLPAAVVSRARRGALVGRAAGAAGWIVGTVRR